MEHKGRPLGGLASALPQASPTPRQLTLCFPPLRVPAGLENASHLSGPHPTSAITHLPFSGAGIREELFVPGPYGVISEAAAILGVATLNCGCFENGGHFRDHAMHPRVQAQLLLTPVLDRCKPLWTFLECAKVNDYEGAAAATTL